ncbi:unnamed protein product [Timema podura]|uniref:Uncharacterized protein n=1 Tax=Timema podura TaxID=61482 RepID=A0ABN7NQN0_TIMPD|nr:unnamed protein product [Timema podura]
MRWKIADVFLKFYFVTRCYNQTIEDLVTNIKEGKVPVPDVIIMNSCLWDISRWGPKGVSAYKDNLLKLMKFFKKSLPPQTLVIWTTTLPISSNAYGGFLIKQVDFLKHTLRFEVMEANLYARDVVATHGYDIVDLHYYFSMQLESMWV